MNAERALTLIEAVAETYTPEGVGIWWRTWAAADIRGRKVYEDTLLHTWDEPSRPAVPAPVVEGQP